MQDWLEARARVSPTKSALIEGQSWLTYDNLYQQAKVRADATQSAYPDIHKGTHVALLGDSTGGLIFTLFALMRIGAVIVPLNTRLTVDELRFQVQQSYCQFVLYDEFRYAEIVRLIVLPGVRVLSFGEAFTTAKMTPQPSREFHLEDPLAIIHTSGTSGQPKGAVLTYGNFFYSAMASANRLGHHPDDMWLAALPLYHVGGLSILMRSILYGITVDLHERFDVDAINQALDTKPVTLISLVPTMLNRLLESGTRWPDSLRLILLGGAGVSPDLIERCRVLNLPIATTYGLTEAASQVATALPEQAYRKPGSVGKPLLFTSIRIVKKDNNPASLDEYGEIVVAGPTIMQSYFNDTKATTATLHDDELYTGDIGYLDEDGDLFIIQRRSDLIISGGENIYPAEIEQVLKQHPDITDAVIIGLPDEEWGQQVAAAIALKPGSTLNSEALIAFCGKSLARYKLPRQIRFVEQFTLTASGKVQRNVVRDLFKGED